METDYLKRHHWRKSSQWFVLTRPHAALAVADKHVIGMSLTRTMHAVLTQPLNLCGSRRSAALMRQGIWTSPFQFPFMPDM